MRNILRYAHTAHGIPHSPAGQQSCCVTSLATETGADRSIFINAYYLMVDMLIEKARPGDG